MHVLITGGTGFIGRAVTLRLRRDGHTVTALTRNVKRARALLGTEAQPVDASADEALLAAAVERADAIVNLAGEPILGRWTNQRKVRLRNSRIDLTRRLARAIRESSNPPNVLVSASAVGFYGDQSDRPLSEEAPAGSGFLAELCRDWEAEAEAARTTGTRVAVMRMGVVLGREGGALDQMLLPFRLGLGGPVGSGGQFVPWIHLEDAAEMIALAVVDPRFDGPFNVSAPEPVSFRTLARALGNTLNRPAILPVPTLALRALFGEGASALVQSHRAVPAKALALGFNHRFAGLEEALQDLVGDSGVTVRPLTGSPPDSAYLKERPPRFELLATTILDRPLQEVFDFFSRPENLGLITPPDMQFEITSLPDTIVEGVEIGYRIRVGPAPLNWRTRIDRWTKEESFVDTQLKGPYASWWHEHSFQAIGSSTRMVDRVLYTPPLGPAGHLANTLFVADELRRVFAYRSAVMRLRFGEERPN